MYQSSSLSSSEYISGISQELSEDVTCLGDSTLDNRLWVEGFIKSRLYTSLGIKRDSSAERVRKSHRIIGKPDLSVVEHVMDMLPDRVVHDYTNDGFTTTDILYGEYRDKVFGKGPFSLFPHEYFQPLEKGAESIKKSKHIILSIGGNDFREFLMKAAREENRADYISKNLHPVLAKMRDQYVDIVKKIRALNKDAQIILMTQYYPSVLQNDYRIYPFMQEIGAILNLGGVSHNPMTVIHEVMKMTYADVLQRVQSENVVVADITSSLNPFDIENHVKQIEPSGSGGEKIGKILKYMITSSKVTPGHAYRFYPEFFSDKFQDEYVEGTDFNHWIPAHPWDLREGYSLEEEKVFRAYNADQLNPGDLLQRFEQAMKQHDEASPTYKAAQRVQEEAEELSNALPESDLKRWKMSMVLALNVLETPKTCEYRRKVAPNFEHEGMSKMQLQTEPNFKFQQAVHLLKCNAQRCAIGKANAWEKFKGALRMLVGAVIIGLSIAGIPFTGHTSALPYTIGSLLFLNGAHRFFCNRQKSLAKETDNLAKEASRQFTP